MCVCLSPEALQPSLILSILQSPYLLSYLFIYLFISPVFLPLWFFLPLLVPYLTVLSLLKTGAGLFLFFFLHYSMNASLTLRWTEKMYLWWCCPLLSGCGIGNNIASLHFQLAARRKIIVSLLAILKYFTKCLNGLFCSVSPSNRKCRGHFVVQVVLLRCYLPYRRVYSAQWDLKMLI